MAATAAGALFPRARRNVSYRFETWTILEKARSGVVFERIVLVLLLVWSLGGAWLIAQALLRRPAAGRDADLR